MSSELLFLAPICFLFITVPKHPIGAWIAGCIFALFVLAAPADLVLRIVCGTSVHEAWRQNSAENSLAAFLLLGTGAGVWVRRNRGRLTRWSLRRYQDGPIKAAWRWAVFQHEWLVLGLLAFSLQWGGGPVQMGGIIAIGAFCIFNPKKPKRMLSPRRIIARYRRDLAAFITVLKLATATALFGITIFGSKYSDGPVTSATIALQLLVILSLAAFLSLGYAMVLAAAAHENALISREKRLIARGRNTAVELCWTFSTLAMAFVPGVFDPPWPPTVVVSVILPAVVAWLRVENTHRKKPLKQRRQAIESDSHSNGGD